jgi:hypothetical protein
MKLLTTIIVTSLFLLTSCGESSSEQLEDSLATATQESIDKISTGAAFAEEAHRSLESVTDDASAQSALDKINALPDRQVYRDLCASIGGPAFLAKDLADEHNAVELKFEEARARLGEQINRIALSGTDGEVVEPGSIKHRLIMAVQ